MTVSNTTSVAQFNGDGAAKSFPFTFRIFRTTDLVVVRRSVSGASTLLTLNTDYTVTGAGSLNGGTVTTTSALASGELLTVARVLTVQQLTDLRNQGDYFAEIHEDVFDYLTMLLQQIAESDSRALRHPRDSEHYQAEGRRIVDLEDPLNDQDAATSLWTKRFVASTIAGVQGPINNAANVFLLKPDGTPGVVQDIAGPNGLEMVGTGNTSLAVRLGLIVIPEQFAPRGLTVLDWAPYIRQAIATGSPVQGLPGKQYPIGSRIDLPANSFVDFKTNGSSILMLTGTGYFDAADYSNGYGTNALGFLANGADNVTLKARITMQPNAGVRTCAAAAARACNNPQFDIHADGFKEAYTPIVAADSIWGGHLAARVENCNPNSTTLATMQLTALGIDYNRLNGVNSRGYTFDLVVRNVLLGADARAKYGEQSDGLNIQSLGLSGARGRVYANTVGEPIDLFCDGCVIDAVIESAYNYGLKFVHGASYNLVRATIISTGGPAVVFAGSNVPAAKDTFGNKVYATVRNVGAIANATFTTNRAAVATDGSSGTYKPRRNYAEITVDGGGSTMEYLAFIDAGQENTFVVDGSGFTVHAGTITSTAGVGNQIKRIRPTGIRAFIGTSQSVASGATVPFDTVLFDTLGEFSTANKNFVCRCAGRYTLHAQVRAASIPAGGFFGIVVVVAGVERARKIETNTNASTAFEGYVDVSLDFNLSAGDTVSVATLSSTAIQVTANNNFSYLEIKPV